MITAPACREGAVTAIAAGRMFAVKSSLPGDGSVRPADADNQIQDAALRPTVQIFLPGGRVLEGPRNASLADFLIASRA